MRRTVARVAVLGYFGGCLLLAAWLGYLWSRSNPAPEQPIAFPHTIHAGSLQLPCTFCHLFAERSRFATAPSVELCMGCHRSIATDHAEIQKLTRHYEEGRPVEWVRVYELPDFIYFSHKRHVKAGVDCSECHGNVREMAKIRRVSSLEMGWCVSCHRVRGASRDCAVCHK